HVAITSDHGGSFPLFLCVSKILGFSASPRLRGENELFRSRRPVPAQPWITLRLRAITPIHFLCFSGFKDFGASPCLRLSVVSKVALGSDDGGVGDHARPVPAKPWITAILPNPQAL